MWKSIIAAALLYLSLGAVDDDNPVDVGDGKDEAGDHEEYVDTDEALKHCIAARAAAAVQTEEDGGGGHKAEHDKEHHELVNDVEDLHHHPKDNQAFVLSNYTNNIYTE
jgi:hypothetical protein